MFNRLFLLTSALGMALLASTPACQVSPQEKPNDKKRTPAPAVGLLCSSAQASEAQDKQTLKAIPKLGITAHFTPRAYMDRKGYEKARPATTPATALPVDCTGKQTVSCPMLGNDQYGDCGPVMCAHALQIESYGQGKAGFTPLVINQSDLVQQYLQVSGGDNGTDEDMLVGPSGIWMSGLTGDSTLTVVDHLDFDITDQVLTQYLIDQFYTVEMAWSVPDQFINTFATGKLYASSGIPDPNNGHYTPLSDVDANGNYGLWTWGTYCWVSQSFVNSVQPQAFVTLGSRQFNAAGYDSKGRHVSQQAAIWVSLGGDAAIAQALVAKFPSSPTPTPMPAPIPKPAPAPATEPSWLTTLISVLPQILSIVVALFGGGGIVHAFHMGKRVPPVPPAAIALMCALVLMGSAQACCHHRLAERLRVKAHKVDAAPRALPNRDETPYQRMPQAPDACPNGSCPAKPANLP